MMPALAREMALDASAADGEAEDAESRRRLAREGLGDALVQESFALVREMADSVVPMTARAVIELENRSGGCRIRMSNDTVLESGTWHVPVFRVMLSLCGGIRGGIKAYLAQIVGRGQARVQWE